MGLLGLKQQVRRMMINHVEFSNSKIMQRSFEIWISLVLSSLLVPRGIELNVKILVNFSSNIVRHQYPTLNNAFLNLSRVSCRPHLLFTHLINHLQFFGPLLQTLARKNDSPDLQQPLLHRPRHQALQRPQPSPLLRQRLSKAELALVRTHLQTHLATPAIKTLPTKCFTPGCAGRITYRGFLCNHATWCSQQCQIANWESQRLYCSDAKHNSKYNTMVKASMIYSRAEGERYPLLVQRVERFRDS